QGHPHALDKPALDLTFSQQRIDPPSRVVRTDGPQHADLASRGIDLNLRKMRPKSLHFHAFNLRVACAHADDQLAAHLARDLPHGRARWWRALANDLGLLDAQRVRRDPEFPGCQRYKLSFGLKGRGAHRWSPEGGGTAPIGRVDRIRRGLRI